MKNKSDLDWQFEKKTAPETAICDLITRRIMRSLD